MTKVIDAPKDITGTFMETRDVGAEEFLDVVGQLAEHFWYEYGTPPQHIVCPEQYANETFARQLKSLKVGGNACPLEFISYRGLDGQLKIRESYLIQVGIKNDATVLDAPMLTAGDEEEEMNYDQVDNLGSSNVKGWHYERTGDEKGDMYVWFYKTPKKYVYRSVPEFKIDKLAKTIAKGDSIGAAFNRHIVKDPTIVYDRYDEWPEGSPMSDTEIVEVEEEVGGGEYMYWPIRRSDPIGYWVGAIGELAINTEIENPDFVALPPNAPDGLEEKLKQVYDIEVVQLEDDNQPESGWFWFGYEKKEDNA